MVGKSNKNIKRILNIKNYKGYYDLINTYGGWLSAFKIGI